MRTVIASLALSMLAASAAPALAQDQPAAPQPTFAVGDPVYGPQQNDVGTITKIVGDNIVVNTGKHEVTLSKGAFAKWPKGLVIAMTRDQLDAAFEQAAAKNEAALATALIEGAEARSLNGTVVLGTVKEVADDFVVMTTSNGEVRIPRTAFVMRPAGLTIGLTAEQFNQAVQQAVPATPPS
jgi:ribosomal protein S1